MNQIAILIDGSNQVNPIKRSISMMIIHKAHRI